MTIVDHLHDLLRKWGGFLVPVLQSVPSWGLYIPLMTFPVIGYFMVMIVSFPGTFPGLFIELIIGELWVDRVLRLIGFGLFTYALIHSYRMKRNGVITTGPYRFMRHPQYFGLVLATMGYTFGSYWLLTHTFGMGFLSASQTIGVWICELLAYIGLASLEEFYLSKQFPHRYPTYQQKVPFFISFPHIRHRGIDTVIAVLIPCLFLWVLVLLVP